MGVCCVFRYQHVVIFIAKWSHSGSNPKRRPKVSGFALQWNIGFSDMGQGGIGGSGRLHNYFLNLTYDMEEHRRQRRVTTSFPKIDMRHEEPPSRALSLQHSS